MLWAEIVYTRRERRTGSRPNCRRRGWVAPASFAWSPPRRGRVWPRGDAPKQDE